MKSSVIRVLSKQRDLSISMALAVLSFVAFLPFTRLDFDRHHDGYMTAAARAVAIGDVIHREVFMQYGPLLTLVQSLVTVLPFPPALALRVFNAMLLAIAIGLIADMGRRSPRWLGVSRLGSECAALLVLVLADFFVGVPMLPWPSTLLVLVLVAHFYLLIVGLYFDERSNHRHRRACLGFSGVMLGSIFFVRPVIFVALFAGLLTVLLIGSCSRQSVTRSIRDSALFAAMTIGLGILALTMFSALGSWWEQNFVWGSSYLGQRSQWLDAAKAQTRTYLPLFLGLSLSAVLAVVVLRFASLSNARTARLVGGISAVALGLTIYFTQSRRGHGMWVASPYQELPVSALMVVVYWVMVAVTILAAFGVLVMLIARKLSARHLILLWASGVSAVSLTQSFPVPDSRHYYWALGSTVVLIPLVVGYVPMIPRRVLLFGSAAVMVITGVTSVHATGDYLDIPRIAGPAGAINAGMLSSPVGVTFVTNFNESYEFLSRVIPAGESALFLTPDGANAAFDGNYRSADAWFVNWGPVPPLSERLAGVRFVVADYALAEQDLGVLVDAGFVESASTDQLRLFERSDSSGD